MDDVPATSTAEPLRPPGPEEGDPLGVVVIGRNEGERLDHCLGSLHGARVVYVDSGSTDGSSARAAAAGARVVELDPSRPFSAARARNAGAAKLLAERPGLTYLQFVDGDCEVREEWLERARAHLDEHPETAVVCGRRRELHPDHSLWNLLCDLEWNTPTGRAASCGGDAMYRAAPFHAAGGFDPSVVAGEEPELCLRLRARGHRVDRLPVEMTSHDAAMVSAWQWARRAVRAGHARAQGVWMHGGPPFHHALRPLASILFWGAIVPVLTVAAVLLLGAIGLLPLAGYPVIALRSARTITPRADTRQQALLYGLFNTLAKAPQLLGVLNFHLRRWRGGTRIIEYR